jgi:DNA-binding transcriptional ArsR family regulator
MEVFAALAEPHRRALLGALVDGERSVNQLLTAVELPQPAVSKHLRVLRDACLVAVRVDGPRRLYRLRTEPFAALDGWLEPYRRLWRHQLDLLADHLDRQPDALPNVADAPPSLSPPSTARGKTSGSRPTKKRGVRR